MKTVFYRSFLVDSSVAQIHVKLVVSTTVIRVVRKGLEKSEEVKKDAPSDQNWMYRKCVGCWKWTVHHAAQGRCFAGICWQKREPHKASDRKLHIRRGGVESRQSAEQQNWTCDPQSRVHKRVALSPSD